MLAFPATSIAILLWSVADSAKMTSVSPQSWESQLYAGVNRRKRQMQAGNKGDSLSQAAFIARLFGMTA
jgi:hypothetical protein